MSAPSVTLGGYYEDEKWVRFPPGGVYYADTAVPTKIKSFPSETVEKYRLAHDGALPSEEVK